MILQDTNNGEEPSKPESPLHSTECSDDEPENSKDNVSGKKDFGYNTDDSNESDAPDDFEGATEDVLGPDDGEDEGEDEYGSLGS